MEQIFPVYFITRTCGYQMKQVTRSRINKRRNCFIDYDVKLQNNRGIIMFLMVLAIL